MTELSDSIHRQLGEMSANLLSLAERISETRQVVQTLVEERRRSDHDRRNYQQATEGRIVRLENQSEIHHRQNTEHLARLSDDISSMKEPVAQFVSIRNRAGALFIAFVSIASVIWTFAEPLYQIFISRLLGNGKS